MIHLSLINSKHIEMFEIEWLDMSGDLPVIVICEGKAYMRMISRPFTYIEQKAHWIREIEEQPTTGEDYDTYISK